MAWCFCPHTVVSFPCVVYLAVLNMWMNNVRKSLRPSAIELFYYMWKLICHKVVVEPLCVFEGFPAMNFAPESQLQDLTDLSRTVIVPGLKTIYSAGLHLTRKQCIATVVKKAHISNDELPLSRTELYRTVMEILIGSGLGWESFQWDSVWKMCEIDVRAH